MTTNPATPNPATPDPVTPNPPGRARSKEYEVIEKRIAPDYTGSRQIVRWYGTSSTAFRGVY